MSRRTPPQRTRASNRPTSARSLRSNLRGPRRRSSDFPVDVLPNSRLLSRSLRTSPVKRARRHPSGSASPTRTRRNRGASTNAVEVAVRVRPLSSAEIRSGHTLAIEMSNQTQSTEVVYPDSRERRNFAFDHSYWSIPGQVSDCPFASQEVIFGDLGRQVVSDAMKGFNSCLFAYGQTGSGKSYTLFGPRENPGIVPRFCHELFSVVESTLKARSGGGANPPPPSSPSSSSSSSPSPSSSSSSPVLSIRIEVSMMEIYMEKVRDLFNPSNPMNEKGLKIRESPVTGTFVEGLTKLIVRSEEELYRLLEEGSRLRTIRATSSNRTSSRAHTVFQVTVTQILSASSSSTAASASGSPSGRRRRGKSKKSRYKVSIVNLIDLAGSERSKKAGTSGQRLREGSIINLSLTVLARVISHLARGVKPGEVVAYRESVLTRLMQSSLGGNSKTIMIACISPSSADLEETVSTLRYATRAKQIKNHARINQDPESALIAQLRAEILRLTKLLAERVEAGASGQGEGGTTSKKEMDTILQQLEDARRIISQLEHTSEMSMDDKIRQSEQLSQERKNALAAAGITGDFSRRKVPHIVNLNEDPFLSESLLYFFKPNALTRIGSTKVVESSAGLCNDIVIRGTQVTHCIVENVENEHVFIEPCPRVMVDQEGEEEEEGEEGEGEPETHPTMTPNDSQFAQVHVNGDRISARTELHTNDRILLGNENVFRFVKPSERFTSESFVVIDWEFCRNEMKVHLNAEMLSLRESEMEQISKLMQKRQELQESVRNLSIKSEEDLQKEHAERTAMIVSLTREIQESKANLESANQQRSAMESRNRELESFAKGCQDQLEETQTEIDRQKKEAAEIQGANSLLKSHLQKTLAEISEKQKECADQKEIQVQLVAACHTLKQKLNEENQEREILEAQRVEGEKEAEELRLTIRSLVSQVTYQRNQKTALEETLRSERERLDLQSRLMRERISALQRTLASTTEEREAQERVLEVYRTQVEEVKSVCADLEEKLREETRKRDALKAHAALLQKERSTFESRNAETTKMLESTRLEQSQLLSVLHDIMHEDVDSLRVTIRDLQNSLSTKFIEQMKHEQEIRQLRAELTRYRTVRPEDEN